MKIKKILLLPPVQILNFKVRALARIYGESILVLEVVCFSYDYKREKYF